MSSVSGLKAKSVSRARRGNARPASLNRLERAVDPDGLLSPEERAWRADQLRTMRKVARVSRRIEVA
ncbi:hypothetical protein [Nocardia spumae]|uniref:hypothetical protein n=1 Tax=Nocardia spumae TaxID=2887190 RepID=UPI001D1519C5|nr:hypothetical protein [Nocardia spumae]